MKLAWMTCVFLLLQDEIPFKAEEEFEIKLQFEFKERPRSGANTIELDRTMKEYERSQTSIPLPYLFLNLRVLKQGADEVRIRVFENGMKSVSGKKFNSTTLFKLDLGFTDDIKDRVGAYEYEIVFLSQDKDPVSKITIYFEEDGTYLVNGQIRGKI
jgi:hypothetical protein